MFKSFQKIFVKKRANSMDKFAATQPVIAPRPSTSIEKKRPPPLPGTLPKKSIAFSHTSRLEETRKIKYISSAPDDFGTHSPHWTIPSSRPDPPAPPDYPGPGQYNIPPDFGVHRKNFVGQTIGVKSETNYATITSGIDYTATRVFPEIRRRSISQQSGRHFYDLPQTPAPSYASPGIQAKKITIGQKYKEKKPDTIPGPAEYDVKRADLPTSIQHALPRKDLAEVRSRSVTVLRNNNNSTPLFTNESVPDTPGPGAYNIIPEMKRPKRWTERLRVKPQKYTRAHSQYDRPWAKD